MGEKKKLPNKDVHHSIVYNEETVNTPVMQGGRQLSTEQTFDGIKFGYFPGEDHQLCFVEFIHPFTCVL